MTHTELATLLKEHALPAYKKALLYENVPKKNRDINILQQYLMLNYLQYGICYFIYHCINRYDYLYYCYYFKVLTGTNYIDEMPVNCQNVSIIINTLKTRIAWMENFIATHYIAPANNS